MPPDTTARGTPRLLALVQRVYEDFKLPFTAKLGTRPTEFLGEVATWDHAEAQLKAALEDTRLFPTPQGNR